MTSREMYDLIQTGDPEAQQQALFELLGMAQTISTAVLELAGEAKMRTGHDPLSTRYRLAMTDFLELKG